MITWSNNFSVNVKEIDDQHKKLVDAINSLETSMKAGKGKDVIGKVLQELADYTVYHFSTEEKYMVKFGYAEYQQHKQAHDNFVRKVTEFQKDFKDAKLGTVISVSDFLQQWLTKHILDTDKKYSTTFNENGLK
jgi:hemerythrin